MKRTEPCSFSVLDKNSRMNEFQEQQAMEIEALESILMDDLEGEESFKT